MFIIIYRVQPNFQHIYQFHAYYLAEWPAMTHRVRCDTIHRDRQYSLPIVRSNVEWHLGRDCERLQNVTHSDHVHPNEK